MPPGCAGRGAAGDDARRFEHKPAVGVGAAGQDLVAERLPGGAATELRGRGEQFLVDACGAGGRGDDDHAGGQHGRCSLCCKVVFHED
jgi:hypothetical protein